MERGLPKSARLEEVGAALQDRLRLIGGNLELPTLRAMRDVLGRLLGIAVGTAGLDRHPGVIAILAQLQRHSETAVRLQLGDTRVCAGSPRLAHVVELNIADSTHDRVDAGSLLELLAVRDGDERVLGC